MAQQEVAHISNKIKIVDLNSLLSCVLCDGYIIDATTITECLHSFCRTCIVSYLQTNKFCPICEVQVHKTRPLMSIRADQTLQDIVYKVVPELFKNEMKRRREFYANQNESRSGVYLPVSGEKRGDVLGCERLIFTPDDVISISLEYCPSSLAFPSKLQIDDEITAHPISETKSLKDMPHRRYLQCPGGLQVIHLKKFLRSKYGLQPDQNIDIMYMLDQLLDEYTLVDLAYAYSWRRNGPMRLFYKIQDTLCKENEPASTSTSSSSVVAASACSDDDARGSSSPSLGAAPSSHLHLQCLSSPPPSPQTAVEPGEMQLEKPNCASMSNDHIENSNTESLSKSNSQYSKDCNGNAIPKRYRSSPESHQTSRSSLKRKTSDVSTSQADRTSVNKSWTKSLKKESTLYNSYQNQETVYDKPHVKNLSRSNDFQTELFKKCHYKSQNRRSSLFPGSINIIAKIPCSKIKKNSITVRSSSCL